MIQKEKMRPEECFETLEYYPEDKLNEQVFVSFTYSTKLVFIIFTSVGNWTALNVKQVNYNEDGNKAGDSIGIKDNPTTFEVAYCPN